MTEYLSDFDLFFEFVSSALLQDLHIIPFPPSLQINISEDVTGRKNIDCIVHNMPAYVY